MIAKTAPLALPIYLLVERRGPRGLPMAIPAAAPIPHQSGLRQCLLAYRNRGTAAAWIERAGRHLEPYGVRQDTQLDRVAAVALGRHECPFLALEPKATGLEAEHFIDLRAWLAGRRPWPGDLVSWCYHHGLTSALPY